MEFDESPEALALSAPPIDLIKGMDAPFLLTRLVFQWFDETIASMQPKQLEEILFMTIPCTEPLDPEYAHTFIEQATGARLRPPGRCSVFGVTALRCRRRRFVRVSGLAPFT